MSEIIQCPTCAKKYKLSAAPPAEFTCRKCNTVMDLSGFGGGAAPEPEPAGVPASRRQRAGGRSRGRRSAKGAAAPPEPSGGGRRAGGRARRRARGRGREPAYDEGADEAGGRGRGKKNDNTLVIGSIAAVVVAAVLVFVFASRDDPLPEDEGTGPGTGVASNTPGSADPLGLDGMPAPGTVPGMPPGAVPVPGVAPPDGGTPAAGATSPTPSGSGRVNVKNVKLQTFPWPDDVDEATRQEAQERLEWIYVGGRDGDEAEDWFVAQGNKVAGFLISEFKRIDDDRGLGDRMAKTDIMVLDRILTKMDGYLARKWGQNYALSPVSEDMVVLRRLQRWTLWWQQGYWKEPVKPWDPRVDEVDEDPENKKDDDGKKPGFDNRAGK